MKNVMDLSMQFKKGVEFLNRQALRGMMRVGDVDRFKKTVSDPFDAAWNTLSDEERKEVLHLIGGRNV